MRQQVLALVLRTWPRRLRDRHGRALVQALDDAWQAESRWWARAALVADGMRAGLAERRAGRRLRHAQQRSREGRWSIRSTTSASPCGRSPGVRSSC
ncbi:MAG TPA: hypothetical protein VMM93_05425 [Vicinamibacterales bacterium]|nr:hypothetical protein [Vicinamibacterales bacterium]